jgi:putative hemolysin
VVTANNGILPAAAGGPRDGPREVTVPPLVKGYLRLGAYVCGAPAWDPDFNTADLLMLLPISALNRRYARHFLKHDPP